MRITVLREPGMPQRGADPNAVGRLQSCPEVEIDYADIDSVLKHGIQGDYFYNAHGEIYPLVLEEELYSFFSKGGGFLHIGGLPFETAVAYQDGAWVEVARTLGDIRNHEGWGNLDMPMDVFRARLGLITFDPPYPGGTVECSQTFDAELIGALSVPGNLPRRGVTVATTVPLEVFKPELKLIDNRSYHGRPVCRETITAGWVNTPDGEHYLPSLQLVKYFGNPYQKDQTVLCRPWAMFCGEIDSDLPAEVYDGLYRWMSSPVNLKNIELESATVHQGETVRPSVSLTGPLPEGWTVAAYCAEQRAEDYQQKRPISWQECAVSRRDALWELEIAWKDGVLLQPVRFVLLDQQKRVRDFVESGVVCWDGEAVKHSRRFQADGCYFEEQRDGQVVEASRWVSGTNWQDRHQYVLTWHNPNPLRIARDAYDMRAHGMTFVRTHYFMPGWFRVMPGEVFEEAYHDFYQSFEPGPEISERHLRALEAHIMLFSELGLIFMPTVYTQTGADMGNPAHWTESSRMTRVRAYRKAQKAFARQIMDRFGDCASISWDICNETNVSMNEVSDWLADMRTIWGETRQILGIGTYTSDDSIALGESADWHSVHTPCCKTYNVFRTGKPCMLQEAWVPTTCVAEGEEDLEKVMNKSIAWTLQFGGSGFMPWNWNMSHTNCRYQGGFVDYWDLELGCAVHPDGTPRRGRKIMQDWADLLAGLSFDQRLHRQVVFIYPKHTVAGAGCKEYFDFFRSNQIPFLGVNDRDFADFDLSDTIAVFAPYYGLGYRQSTYERLVEFARQGGTVFAHNDSMQLDENGEFAAGREIPPFGKTVPVGKGKIRWYLGFNDSNPLGVCDPALFAELPIQRYSETCIPLMDGKICFTERFSTEEKTMNTDWVPNQKLADRNMPVKIEIRDTQDRTFRGWLKDGESVSVGGLTFTSENPLFVLRVSDHEVIASGSEFDISGENPIAGCSLVDYSSQEGNTKAIAGAALRLTPSEQGAHVSLQGWQRMHWVSVRT